MLTYQQFILAHKRKYAEQIKELYKHYHPLADMMWVYDGLNAVAKAQTEFNKKSKRLYRRYRRGKYTI